jgi:hypothetical protein
MRLFLSLLLILLLHYSSFSQSYLSEQEAKVIVNKISSVSGLTPSVIVTEDHNVKKAVAFIKNNEQHISYNPFELGRIRDSSGTAWSVVSIFAHEMAHHLLGHTLNPTNIDKQDELKCDRFAGHILCRLGATQAEALAVIPFTGTHSGTETHPPREHREIAALNGWEEANSLNKKKPDCSFLQAEYQTPLLRVNLISDKTNYYLLSDMILVWYDEFGRSHSAGKAEKTEDNRYPFVILLDKKEYFVSEGGTIWNRTDYNAMMQIGTALFISRSFLVDSE